MNKSYNNIPLDNNIYYIYIIKLIFTLFELVFLYDNN